MAIGRALIGARGTSSGSSVTTTAGTSTGGSGNHGIMFVSFDATTTVSTVSDSKSNTYTQLGSTLTSADGAKLAIYYCLNWTGGTSHTGTMTFSGSAFPVLHLVEVTGAATSSPFDVSVTSTSHPYSIASGTLSQAAEVVFIFGEQNSSGNDTENYTSSSSTILSQEPALSSFWTSGVASSITASTTTANYQLQKNTSSLTGQAIVISVKEAGAGGVSGTVAKTNVNDTLSAAGTTTVVGSLAKTNVNDTLSASGSGIITGTLAVTNANDTLAASGSVTPIDQVYPFDFGLPPAWYAVPGFNSLYAYFQIGITVANRDDITVDIGTVNVTNVNDTSAASGTTTILGTLAKTNVNDTSAVQGTTTVLGTLATTNVNDTLNANGSVGSAVGGSLAVTNVNDTLASSGTTTIVSSLATTNLNDTSSASGTTTVTGTLSNTNGNDTLAASGASGTPPLGIGTKLPLTGAGG